jgi:serine/threonine protein kinase
MVGEIISHYRLLSQIGEGGMGLVYLGEQTNLNRKVAIKELHTNLTSNPQFKERFINEAKILAKLSHPNIVTVYDLLFEGGRFFIVMEYVTGENVSSVIIRSRSAFEMKRCIHIFKHILSAFSYAHAEGIIHRDIKPSNIILGPNDVPKILDFGIAKITSIDLGITKTGTKMGSVFYMSPEQVMGEQLDKRTDVYSLGVTLFEMLTGTLPFSADTDSEYKIQTKIVSEPLPTVRHYNPHLPEQLDWIIAKATAKRAIDRYTGCEQFYYALDSILGGTDQQANYQAYSANQQKTQYSGSAPASVQNSRPGNQYSQPQAAKTVAVPQPSHSGQQYSQPNAKTVAVSQPSQTYHPQASYPQAKKKKSILPFILIPVILIFFVMIAVIVYFAINSDDTSGSTKVSDNSKTKTESKSELSQKEEELKRREQKIEEDRKKMENNNSNTSGQNSNSQNNSIPGVYPEGSTRSLTESDVRSLSRYELSIMRNEIFARHGYIFKSNPEMIKYFNNQSWYTPQYYDVTNMLSEIEKFNVNFIKNHER